MEQNDPIRVFGVDTRARDSVYRVNHFMLRGTYQLIITAPFDTRMAVSPLNPPAGLQFLPDQDPMPSIWNSRIVTPRAGQYTFQIRLDRPVDNSELLVQFILQAVANPPTPPPPPPPSWPPPGPPQAAWSNPYYQRAIRILHPLWIAELNRRIKITNGPQWYVDPYGRAIGPGITPVGPPTGAGSPDPAAYCWLNLQPFHLWINQQPRPI
ncbi:MAG: hypothetical protein ISS72_00995 [Candidatus Brocadiae bacterium]|nr:hypothetical protein [Candidatus Brocadiia bacterium]